jgi:hypothetical protein
MERDRTLKHNLEPDEDQPIAGPHHQSHHEASLHQRLPHEGEREEHGEHTSLSYLLPQQRRSHSTEHMSLHTEHTSSANALTWHFNDDFHIVVHSIGCQLCKEYSLHFCSGMLEQDISHRHAREVLCAHFVVNTCESIRSVARGSRQTQKLKHELDLCCKENNNLRHQVRHYCNEVDDMRQQEYKEHHDHYEWHGSYNCRKQHHTSTEVTPSSLGGYAWPSAETPQVVVSPPQSPTLPGNPISPPQVPSPVAPMEVDPDWPPLPPPGKRNQLDANTPWLPIIPMHHALGEHDTSYPMLPKGCH